MGEQRKLDHATISRLIAPYRVSNGEHFRLKDFDPADTGPYAPEEKDETRELLRQGVELLAQYEERLFAQHTWALLMILQAMDAAGKDSTIKHVMSGVNPQGCRVTSFKRPSDEELDHDYLWRCHRALPPRGCVGIFNRSYYEEVLVVRVHPDLFERERLPDEVKGNDVWESRYKQIREYESYLDANGIAVNKFFLHLSYEEQRKRFLKRLEEPEKNWKFSPDDVHERRYWDDYMKVYERMIRATVSRHAPWFVVPADHKWFTRLVVAGALVDTLHGMHLKFPVIDMKRNRELKEIDKLLREEDGRK
jgi:PPK2 family polyphosphate:nucleotide phosphotransferase